MQERLLADEIMRRIHVSLPGTVLSYNPDNRTVNVQPSYRATGSSVPMAQIKDVPVFFPGNLLFPVNVGDECLVVFADKCIDAWFTRGGVSSPPLARMHDLSDGFAFVGLFSKPNLGKGTELIGEDGRLRSGGGVSLSAKSGTLGANASVDIEPTSDMSILIAQNGTNSIMYMIVKAGTSVSASGVKTNSSVTVSVSSGIVTVSNGTANAWTFRIIDI